MSLPIYQRVAVSDSGDVIPGAEYTVINENTGVAAPIYSDRTGATLLSAPYFADSVGTIQFFIAQGTTFRVAASGGVGTYTDRYIYAAHPQASATDTTAGSLMAVGAFGLGDDATDVSRISDCNNITATGFYITDAATTLNSPTEGVSSGWLFQRTFDGSNGYAAQEFNSIGDSGKFIRTKVAGTWTAWIQVYTTLNAVGSVSSSGYGSIIETGTNSNGRYTMFADGTMICSNNFTWSTSIDTLAGGIYRSPNALGARQFPGPLFTSISHQSAFVHSETNSISWVVNGGSGESLGYWRNIYLCDSTSQTTISSDVYFTATGRWKV